MTAVHDMNKYEHDMNKLETFVIALLQNASFAYPLYSSMNANQIK